jgi:hypothetical protein
MLHYICNILHLQEVPPYLIDKGSLLNLCIKVNWRSRMTPEQNARVKNLKTPEDIFNYVENHLRIQGQSLRNVPSDNDGAPECAYRGVGGRSCAVGCLIADDEYNPEMEGTWVPILADMNILPPRLKPHLRLLTSLQGFHDDEDNWNDNRRSFSQTGEMVIRLLRNEWLRSK